MMRRVLSVLTALMLALLCVSTGYAATRYTVTVQPGAELSSIDGVAELAAGAAFRSVTGNGASLFSLILKNESVLDVAVGSEGDSIYAYSSLTGKETYTLNQAAMMAMLDQQIPGFSSILEQVKKGLASLAEGETPIALPSSTEDMIARMDSMAPGLGDWLRSVMNRVVTEDGQFYSANHDPATHKTVLTVSMQDILTLVGTQFFRSSLVQSLNSQGFSGQFTDEQLDALIAEVKEQFSKGTFMMRETVYSTDTEPISVEIVLSADFTAVSGASDASFIGAFSMDKLTTEVGPRYDITASLNAAGNDVQLRITAPYAGAESAMAAVMFSGTQYTFTYDKTQTETGSLSAFSLYTRENAKGIIPPTADLTPWLRVNVSAEEVGEEELSVLNKAQAIDVLTMTAEQGQELAQNLQNNYQTLFMNLLSALPESILNLIFK